LVGAHSAMGDRDERGRLLPGHSVRNPGGQYGLKEREYREVLYKTVTPETYARLLQRMIRHVDEKGSIRAFTVITEQLMGKPTQRTEDQQAAMPEWLMMVLQVQPKQVNESEEIGLLNGSYINLLPAEVSLTDSDQAINVDTTIGIDEHKATKTPALGEQAGINVDTTIDRGARGASGQRKEEEEEREGEGE
jgi:hypothetical protein